MIGVPSATGTGSWGRNVLSWSGELPAQTVQIRYEELIAHPVAVARHAVDAVAPHLSSNGDPEIPSFEELQKIDPLFFRRGIVGSHRDELPEDLEELFWSRGENREAMELLGYAR